MGHSIFRTSWRMSLSFHWDYIPPRPLFSQFVDSQAYPLINSMLANHLRACFLGNITCDSHHFFSCCTFFWCNLKISVPKLNQMILNFLPCSEFLCNLQIQILHLVWYIFIKVSAQTQYAVKYCQYFTLSSSPIFSH